MSKIYYLENDENDLFLLRMAFKREGYEDSIRHFEYLSHFQLALQNVAPEPPRLFLFDLKLNGESGLDALQWVKERPAFAGIPAFLFSSGTVPHEIMKSMDMDVSAYIFKPMNREGWREVVLYLADVAGLEKMAARASVAQPSACNASQGGTAAT
jgi:response regulator RpfG family c-di-GMP phosphodiesterase